MRIVGRRARFAYVACWVLATACTSADPACHEFVYRDDAGAPPPFLSTLLGEPTSAARRTPALAGGTLLIAHDGSLAVASDPDLDRVVVVATAGPVRLGEVALETGDEPGRLAEDAAGLVHVVLRRGGAVVTFDPITREIRARRAVCPTPRGIAFDPTRDVLHVACASGELVTLPAAPSAAIERIVRVADDLRDVVIDGDRLLVARFRAGEVLDVDPTTGAVARTLTLDAGGGLSRLIDAQANTVWRLVRSPEGAFALYQSTTVETPIGLDSLTYGSGRGGCEDSVVRPVMAMIEGNVAGPFSPLPCGSVSVDAAISPDGERVAIASSGVSLSDRAAQIQIFDIHPRQGGPRWVDLIGIRRVCPPTSGRVVALAYTPDGSLVVQTRDPGAVFVVAPSGALTAAEPFGGPSTHDAGFDAFHSAGHSSVACASCHAEGGDDGRVWQVDGVGPRRTLSLRGGVLAGAPFQWSGDVESFDVILTSVFTTRMGGGVLHRPHVEALTRWLEAEPELPPRHVDDADAVARGRALFEGERFGCTSCHAGERLTQASSIDLGAGPFQVPSLRGVADRAPYLHDGCAATLGDVFDRCDPSHRHLGTSDATVGDVLALAAYLASL